MLFCNLGETSQHAGLHTSFERIFMLLFFYLGITAVIILQLFGTCILQKLKEKDTLQKVIRPRPFGILVLIGTEILILAILGAAIYALSILIAVFLPLAVAHTILLFSTLSVRLNVDKHRIDRKSVV